jgi:LemA protein
MDPLILIIGLAVVGVFLVVQYNRLIRLNVRVDEAFGQIEVQLQRRADLIPNLVETVKGYAAQEKTTLESVTAARSQTVSAHGLTEVAAADNMMTNALRGLLAISEAYPDLKSSENFRALQEELATTENKIGFARQYYNDNVSSLNQAVTTIPGKFFAGPAKVTQRDFYVVDDPSKRDVPKVQF